MLLNILFSRQKDNKCNVNDGTIPPITAWTAWDTQQTIILRIVQHSRGQTKDCLKKWHINAYGAGVWYHKEKTKTCKMVGAFCIPPGSTWYLEDINMINVDALTWHKLTFKTRRALTTMLYTTLDVDYYFRKYSYRRTDIITSQKWLFMKCMIHRGLQHIQSIIAEKYECS